MKRPYLVLLVLMLSASLSIACGSVERGEAKFEPTAAEAEVPELYRLAAAGFDFERELIDESSSFRVFAVRFASPIVTSDAENNTVHAEYFEPKDGGAGKRPAMVVLHILGADFALSRYMAARLAQKGVAALFVKLPYYGERKPKGSNKRFLSVDVERSLLSMRQGVCDVRRAVAWLGGREDIDRERIGVIGISLGGIVASLAVAIDPAINEGVFLLAGGNLADILWNMPESRRYRELWTAAGRTKADLAKLTRPFDPLTYAHRLQGKRILMIAGTFDEVIPPSSPRALWEAAGKPSIIWYDCGHYSAAGFLLPAIRRTVEFAAKDPPAR